MSPPPSWPKGRRPQERRPCSHCRPRQVRRPAPMRGPAWPPRPERGVCDVATYVRAVVVAVDGSILTIRSSTQLGNARPTMSWNESVGLSSNVEVLHSSLFVAVTCPAATLAMP
eukprot:6758137-Prymnesium_polylepis.1